MMLWDPTIYVRVIWLLKGAPNNRKQEEGLDYVGWVLEDEVTIVMQIPVRYNRINVRKGANYN
jgi:hypothetical protein